MIINYHGHACFTLKTSSNITLIFDPFGDIGYNLGQISADYAIVSHSHYDHNNVSAVSNLKGIILNGDFALDNLTVKSVKTYHDTKQGALRGKNFIHIVNVDGLKIVHLGDFGEDVSLANLSFLDNTDILFIPVGGTYTIDALSAKKIVDLFNIKMVIPMHFKTPSSTVDVDDLDKFTDLFSDGLIFNTDNGFNINDLPKGKKIVVFDYKNF